MRTADTIIERLWNIAEPVCANSGYELVDIVHTQSPQGWVVRVFIDHLPGPERASTFPHEQDGEANGTATGHFGGSTELDSAAIDLSDCELVSRELSAVLDVEDPLDHAYNLEVSSPGLDRPLRKPSHFERYLGQMVKVTLREGLEGRRNFKGTVLALERETDGAKTDQSPGPMTTTATTLVVNVDGTEYRLPFNDIQNARLVPDWNDLFRRSRKR